LQRRGARGGEAGGDGDGRRTRDAQSVLDALLDGVLVLGEGGRIDTVNAEACRILETSSEALEGSTLGALLGEEHPLPQLVGRVLAGRHPVVQDEIRLDTRQGEPLEVDVAVSPLEDAERQGGGAVVRLRDPTIHNSLREIVAQREQLDSYGHIAAGIAHEVKNPLGGIRGAAELLALRAPDDRARDAAGLIVREVDRIASLVEELMVFARGDVLAEDEVNLHYVLDGVLDLIGHDPAAGKVEVERFYDPSIPEIVADADRLTQVFLNLCRNAVQAMEATGGTLTITTRTSVDRRLAGPDGRRLPAVIVAVSDTGPGIPADVIDRLATPFFTTRPQGTGLGLAVARHWVSRHGGTLRLASQPGEGTTARVALPLRLPTGGGKPR